MKKSVAILGASGYTGIELLRLLANHDHFEVAGIYGASSAGKTLSELYGHLPSYDGLLIRHISDIQKDLDQYDLIFAALPHGESASLLLNLSGCPLIDLSADFRLKDPARYPEWYGKEHECPEKLSLWTYGLPELFREKIKGAKLIANPGCYPTSVLLPLAPLYKAGLVEGTASITSYSGTTGGGRVPKPELHFAHCFEDMRAYKLGRHQHTPEIEQGLKDFSQQDILVSFSAHLAPLARGIHTTITARCTPGANTRQVMDVLQAAYEDEPFIQIVDRPPSCKSVRGTNCCKIHAHVDERTGQLILVSVIDNLVKGAAGQAIQNANIIFELPETTGLPVDGVYP